MIQLTLFPAATKLEARRNLGSYLQAGVLAALTLPVELLGWIALGLDRVLPSQGMYMGPVMSGLKPSTTKADGALRSS